MNTSTRTNATSATWLHTTYSLDGGATWSQPAVASIEGGAPAVACSMCMTRAKFDEDTGKLSIVFRSGACVTSPQFKYYAWFACVDRSLTLMALCFRPQL